MSETRVSSKWVIVFTLAIVVAAFIGSTVYAELRAARTHALTAEIAINESPSIEHLASARAELRDLQRLLSTHVLLASRDRQPSTEPLRQVRARLNENLDAYFALPALPGERELWSGIEKELADVDVLSDEIVRQTASGDYAEARRLLVDVLPAAIDEEADAIITAIQLNAARVRDVAEKIEGARRRRMLWVFGLDGVSVALAVLLAMLALRSITRQESLLRHRSEELEAFAGRVAHDLLNPLAAVELSMSQAERAEDPTRRATALARARRASGRARRLIDDLLAFAQAGARPVGAVASVAGEAVEGVVEELRAPALEQHITLRVEVPAAPIGVRCASGVLTSLLANLLRNAIKHMGERPVKQVRVSVTRLNARVRFEVEDTGPGLPPGLEDRAFDPYVRGAGTTTPGLGLGLATVRLLVDGHGGRLGVRSSPGQGSLFWFELPAAPVPPTAPLAARTATSDSQQALPLH
ncbi:MAG TPA: ATP-binding protein [Polyangia bacterium]|jgi:signal transduction histidine kinase